MSYPDWINDLSIELELNPDPIDKALVFLRDMSFDEHPLLSAVTMPAIFFVVGIGVAGISSWGVFDFLKSRSRNFTNDIVTKLAEWDDADMNRDWAYSSGFDLSR